MCHGVAAITNFGRPGIHINAVDTRPGYITDTIKQAAVTMLLHEALAMKMCAKHSMTKGSRSTFESSLHDAKNKITSSHVNAVLQHPDRIMFRGYWINEPSSSSRVGNPHSAATAEIVAASDDVLAGPAKSDWIKSIKDLRKKLKKKSKREKVNRKRKAESVDVYGGSRGRAWDSGAHTDWKDQVRANTLRGRIRAEARRSQAVDF